MFPPNAYSTLPHLLHHWAVSLKKKKNQNHQCTMHRQKLASACFNGWDMVKRWANAAGLKFWKTTKSGVLDACLWGRGWAKEGACSRFWVAEQEHIGRGACCRWQRNQRCSEFQSFGSGAAVRTQPFGLLRVPAKQSRTQSDTRHSQFGTRALRTKALPRERCCCCCCCGLAVGTKHLARAFTSTTNCCPLGTGLIHHVTAAITRCLLIANLSYKRFRDARCPLCTRITIPPMITTGTRETI